MKTADLTMTWRERLEESGPTAVVGMIRDSLLSQGVIGRAEISKALELLFAILPPDDGRRLYNAIAKDASSLRDSQANERSDSARTTALRHKLNELQAKIAELKGARLENDELHRRLNDLVAEEKGHHDAISQLASECMRLSASLQRYNGP